MERAKTFLFSNLNAPPLATLSSLKVHISEKKLSNEEINKIMFYVLDIFQSLEASEIKPRRIYFDFSPHFTTRLSLIYDKTLPPSSPPFIQPKDPSLFQMLHENFCNRSNLKKYPSIVGPDSNFISYQLFFDTQTALDALTTNDDYKGKKISYLGDHQIASDAPENPIETIFHEEIFPSDCALEIIETKLIEIINLSCAEEGLKPEIRSLLKVKILEFLRYSETPITLSLVKEGSIINRLDIKFVKPTHNRRPPATYCQMASSDMELPPNLLFLTTKALEDINPIKSKDDLERLGVASFFLTSSRLKLEMSKHLFKFYKFLKASNIQFFGESLNAIYPLTPVKTTYEKRLLLTVFTRTFFTEKKIESFYLEYMTQNYDLLVNHVRNDSEDNVVDPAKILISLLKIGGQECIAIITRDIKSSTQLSLTDHPKVSEFMESLRVLELDPYSPIPIDKTLTNWAYIFPLSKILTKDHFSLEALNAQNHARALLLAKNITRAVSLKRQDSKSNRAVLTLKGSVSLDGPLSPSSKKDSNGQNAHVSSEMLDRGLPDQAAPVNRINGLIKNFSQTVNKYQMMPATNLVDPAHSLRKSGESRVARNAIKAVISKTCLETSESNGGGNDRSIQHETTEHESCPREFITEGGASAGLANKFVKPILVEPSRFYKSNSASRPSISFETFDARSAISFAAAGDSFSRGNRSEKKDVAPSGLVLKNMKSREMHLETNTPSQASLQALFSQDQAEQIYNPPLSSPEPMIYPKSLLPAEISNQQMPTISDDIKIHPSPSFRPPTIGLQAPAEGASTKTSELGLFNPAASFYTNINPMPQHAEGAKSSYVAEDATSNQRQRRKMNTQQDNLTSDDLGFGSSLLHSSRMSALLKVISIERSSMIQKGAPILSGWKGNLPSDLKNEKKRKRS
jgi:hypothetical protein